MSKQMCIIDKRNEASVENFPKHLKLDELYLFIERKPRTQTREDAYEMTIVVREPHQIVGFDVAFDISQNRIQNIIDNAPDAKKYCTDNYLGYILTLFATANI